jgi:pyruvate formate lyase activating enzyme
MKGLVFSVKKYSVHDGPGIRVTFFMKGCPLKCDWCHNPEGILPFPETVKKEDKVGEEVFNSSEEVGKFYDVSEILDIIEKDRIFIKQSKGGVTFSGGEPMLQSEFLLKALQACKGKGFHTAVDTSGYSPIGNFEMIVPFTNLFLFDIKNLNNKKHIESTGVSNLKILDAFKFLTGNAEEVWIRIPVIPGYNDDPDHLDKLKKFIIRTKTESLKKICLLPFHRTGSSKYKRFNFPYKMDDVQVPSKERMQELKDFFSDVGIKVKIGG